MIYTYINRYIVFVAPFMDVRDRDQVQKWAQKIEFWSGSGSGEKSGSAKIGL